MVLPEDEQRAFEAKMDQFLLQENLPKVLTENEQSANQVEDSEGSEASNYQSQNSQIYSQQSMPFFLMQIQNNVAQKAGAIPPKSQNKKKLMHGATTTVGLNTVNLKKSPSIDSNKAPSNSGLASILGK